ncbi:tetratricopeptide repeat protein [Olivibacter sp. SDN3]|uniref:tetratricopeptide repeat protein n=1 Tax=Olivibacter sp. SDN3 TaxID=2764720 RepID=UPI001651409D|nr:tetratricopeptide repeat protein [Olivibacter sp. SDN3]QNL49859.1 tetratricopeptide repeat protein [Olivibacter sp. SDN3]
MLWIVGNLRAQHFNAADDIRDRLERYTFQPSDSLFLEENERYKRAILHEDPLNQGMALQRMGQICYQLGLFAQSLNYHLQANDVFQSENNERLKADNLNDLGLGLLINNQEETAKQAYLEALDSYRKQKDQKGIANTYANFGHLYEKVFDYDSAYYYQQEAMKVFEAIGDLDGVAFVHENLGSIYEDKEEYDQAYVHFSKALSRFQHNGNTAMLIDAYNNIGDIHRKSGRYQEALLYTRKAAKLSREISAYSRLSSAYRDLGKTFYFLKHSDSTFHYLEQSRALFLNIYTEDSKNQAALLKVLYDLDRKDARIAEMGREKRIATILYIASGVVALLLVALAFVVIRNQRQRIRSERKIREKEKTLSKTKQQLMETDLMNKKLKEEQMKKTLESKAREITSHTLQAIEKNQLLEEVKWSITAMIKSDGRSYKKELRRLLNKIHQNFNKDVHWEDFRRVFEEINQDFFQQLQKINPDLSSTEIRLVSLIKLNMSTPDIAALLGISTDSLRVSRYRLRKKLRLEQGKSLTAFLQGIS